MDRYLTVNCPKCGHGAVFDMGSLAEADARHIIAIDARCCRRCGTLLVEEEEEEEEEEGQDDDS